MRRVFSIPLLFICSVCAAAQAPQKVELDLKDINGRSLRLADYKGKVLLINFWATWCIPCRSEIPDLVKWQKQYRAQGLRIVGITYPPENISEVRRYVKELKMNYPVAIGTKETKTKFTRSEILPITVVLDRDGVIRDVIEGIIYPDEFEQKVNPLFTHRIGQRVTKQKISFQRAACLTDQVAARERRKISIRTAHFGFMPAF